MSLTQVNTNSVFSSEKTSVLLLGMPGAGKSTLGLALSKALDLNFVDTDALLCKHIHRNLQSYLDEYGYLSLREQEELALLDSRLEGSVIASGGSVVYSPKVMSQLIAYSCVVYLKLAPESLSERIGNFDSRGIASEPGSSVESIYKERSPLYEHYAELTLNCDNKSEKQCLMELIELLSN